MTPTEADHLLADRLMERRSRAGSVLSDQQAQEVVRLLSPQEPQPEPHRKSSKEKLNFSSQDGASSDHVIGRTSFVSSEQYVSVTQSDVRPALPPRYLKLY